MGQSTTEQRARHRVTFAVLALGVAAFALLQSLVNPVLPTIQEELQSSQTDVTWVLTANLMAASVFTPILGRLGDMTGKKRMFVVGLGAMALGLLVWRWSRGRERSSAAAGGPPIDPELDRRVDEELARFDG